MREFLDRYSIRQIVAASIIAAVLGVEGLFYAVGGWRWVFVITAAAIGVGAIVGIIAGVAWLLDYIGDRKSREFWEKKRKEADHEHTRATGL